MTLTEAREIKEIYEKYLERRYQHNLLMTDITRMDYLKRYYRFKGWSAMFLYASGFMEGFNYTKHPEEQ